MPNIRFIKSKTLSNIAKSLLIIIQIILIDSKNRIEIVPKKTIFFFT
jgi:hypothetical protein